MEVPAERLQCGLAALQASSSYRLTFDASPVGHKDAGYVAWLFRGDWRFQLFKPKPGTVFTKQDIDLGDNIVLFLCTHLLHRFARLVPQKEWLGTHDTIADRMLDFDPWVCEGCRLLASWEQLEVGDQGDIETSRASVVYILAHTSARGAYTQ